MPGLENGRDSNKGRVRLQPFNFNSLQESLSPLYGQNRMYLTLNANYFTINTSTSLMRRERLFIFMTRGHFVPHLYGKFASCLTGLLLIVPSQKLINFPELQTG